ncbi:PA14 domain-containing protein [Cerasicoccus arenae]|uniref:PA14 domain-containing protein n=1 Tax=Cerasicoccus arenae TaxID=424488 RepID=A0A8J3GE95_9BACT|nr:PA14 domain-containing protein [Cerasicoccus arenae]MBK1859823.1 hypothetical protein [Cerasicoccus arenae]GHC01520.1 hypothetical protein GCM10007047_17530 [Cerasicoccus arenae]
MRRKVNLPLVEVLVVSLIAHFVALFALGGFTIFQSLRATEPELVAPDIPSAIPPPPPEIKVQLSSTASAPVMTRSVVSMAEIMPLDMEVPVIQSSDSIGIGKISGAGGIGQLQGMLKKQSLNIDSFGTVKQLDHSWVGTIYTFDHISRLRSDNEWFKDVKKKRRQTQKIYSYAFNLTVRDFTDGFPGVTDQFEWFAIDFKAVLEWPQELAGEYEFRLSSDDGSILEINGKEIIDNDGNHGMQAKTGKAVLKAGKQRFHLAYYQGPAKSIGLVLEYRRTDEKSWKIFDLQDFHKYQ